MPTKYTFWKLLNEYSIEIPIIQRDYSQGGTSERISNIRNKLIEDIYGAFQGDSLDLDFVYGDIRIKGSKRILIPLDGQQRLTTLFLLHWYLANKDGRIVNYRDIFFKFSYRTRTSAREFCSELIEKGIKIPASGNKDKLSDLLKNTSWFFLSWQKDPTVAAMLVMLDAIHDAFRDTSAYFEQLRTLDNISFHFIPLESFGLTDNLYIKMNSRGKSLTEYEEFKASFIDFIDVRYDQEIKNTFSFKIDNEWLDYFWKHKEDNLIDNPFLRYFYFVTEMLYFQSLNEPQTTSPFEFEGKNPKINFQLVKDVYSDYDNLDFLFKSLDNINEIEDSLSSIFYKSEFENGKVALFDPSINLLKRCVRDNDFGIYEKVLLFSIIQYCIFINNSASNHNIVDYIRVIRNLLFKVRALEQTVYRSYLRYETISNILSSIKNHFLENENIYFILSNKIDLSSFTNRTRISPDDLNHEISKAKIINQDKRTKEQIHRLEDHVLLKGAIHNFNIESNLNELPSFNNSMNEIWSLEQESIISRSLFTLDDYSLRITKCALGKTYLYGDSKTWNTILTKTGKGSKKIKTILPSFLVAYATSQGESTYEKLVSLIDNWLQVHPRRDWRYYFIKYPEISMGDKNYYARLNDFETRNLGSYSFNPLIAYHINPYVRAVMHIISDENICHNNQSKGRYGEVTPLSLTNGMKLFCKIDGWHIVLPEKDILSDDIIQDFGLKETSENNKYLLADCSKYDRIEKAIRFIKKVYSEAGD